MSSLWQSARASLDDSLVRISESMENLKAARSIDVAEVVEQLAQAAEAAQGLRSAVASALPQASWHTREELDALLAQVQRISVARSRLLALAKELERGNIVHRRALRVDHLNQLRDQAINELRTQADAGAALPTLPGPEADRWVEWACALKEPEDAEALEALQSGFGHLDNFVANLETGMWVVQTETVS